MFSHAGAVGADLHDITLESAVEGELVETTGLAPLIRHGQMVVDGRDGVVIVRSVVAVLRPIAVAMVLLGSAVP